MSQQPAFDFAQHFDPSEFIAQPQPLTPVQQELKRRSANADAILERLRKGPATNGELAQIGGLRYSARIFELRKHGVVVNICGGEGGKFVYSLGGVSCPK